MRGWDKPAPVDEEWYMTTPSELVHIVQSRVAATRLDTTRVLDAQVAEETATDAVE